MKEFTITVSYAVDARNYDEAVEIAKVVRREIELDDATHGYKLRDVETQRIEEL